MPKLDQHGKLHLAFPNCVQLITDREGSLQSLVGMTIRTVKGVVQFADHSIAFEVKGNERLDYSGGAFHSVMDIGVVTPKYG